MTRLGVETASPEALAHAGRRDLRGAIARASACRRMTQGQLPERSRSNKRFISNLERGRTTPTLRMLIRLAAALDRRGCGVGRRLRRRAADLAEVAEGLNASGGRGAARHVDS